MKTISLFIFIFFAPTIYSQGLYSTLLSSSDTSKTYFKINLKEKYDFNFSKDESYPIFNDSISFSNYLDSACINKEIPRINFSKYFVSVEQICFQCNAHCQHENGNYNFCHRNACNFQYIFYKKRKN